MNGIKRQASVLHTLSYRLLQIIDWHHKWHRIELLFVLASRPAKQVMLAPTKPAQNGHSQLEIMGGTDSGDSSQREQPSRPERLANCKIDIAIQGQVTL